MDLKEEQEIYEDLVEPLDDEDPYRERLYSEFPIYNTFGFLGAIAYGRSVGESSLGSAKQVGRNLIHEKISPVLSEEGRMARHIAGLWGLNSRIVDDLLDGDSCEGIKDREAFLDSYISAVTGTRHTEPLETRTELVAYRAGERFGELLDDRTERTVESYLREMKESVKDEDKKTREGYREYSHTAGGLTGEVAGAALDTLPGYDQEEEVLNMCYEMGLMTQIADDIYDGDVHIDDGELEEIFRIERDKLSSAETRAFAFTFDKAYEQIGKAVEVWNSIRKSKNDLQG